MVQFTRCARLVVAQVAMQTAAHLERCKVCGMWRWLVAVMVWISGSARAEAAPPTQAPAPPSVEGSFALDQERWTAVDALAFPDAARKGTWLVFSSAPFDRVSLGTLPALSLEAVRMHQLMHDRAVTLRLWLDDAGRLRRVDYGRGDAVLDSPLDFAEALHLEAADGRLVGRLQHEWLDLRFDVPVTARIEVAQASTADATHPAARALVEFLGALHGEDVQRWIRASQPAHYPPGDDASERAQQQLTRKVFPVLRAVEGVRVVSEEQALVDFRGSKGRQVAVMALEADGRWMLQQVGAR